MSFSQGSGKLTAANIRDDARRDAREGRFGRHLDSETAKSQIFGMYYFDLFDRNGRPLDAKKGAARVSAIARIYVPAYNAEAGKANPGPPGAAFQRCVKSVQERGGAYDPRAVCAAAGRKKYGAKTYQEMAAAGRKRAARKRGNPPEAAVEAYEDFHGRQPDEMVEVTKQVHYHKHLAGAGKLEKLEVVSRRGDKVILSQFKGALLCFNEKRTQLFIEGGDQRPNLRDFGISSPHEMEVLGEVIAVEYFTRKDHLGRDGGTAIYRHKFSKPYPELQYDVVNEQLIFSGGNYVILAEGIDR